MSNDNILDVRELNTYYGRSQVLFDVNLSIGCSGGVAILGRNGAGKTTLLKTIAGELAPEHGTMLLDGVDITKIPTESRIKRGLAYVPQEHAVFGKLSVLDNLKVGAITNKDKSQIDSVLEMFPKLAQRLTQDAGTLSGGERKMLAIGRALLSSPNILLLDEPTEGVWIGVIEEIAERLFDLAQRISVVIVEQNVDLALRISDYAYVIDRGHVALKGPSEKIRDHPDLLRYLAP